jgi:hypothetical protein
MLSECLNDFAWTRNNLLLSGRKNDLILPRMTEPITRNV